MAKPLSMTDVTTAMFELLEPLSSEDRQRCIRATMVLLGEGVTEAEPARLGQGDQSSVAGSRSVGEKLKKFMVAHKISQSQLDQLFHIDDEVVEIIADLVPGSTKKERTINCYLLVGVRNLILNDEPRFADQEALEFCQRTRSYDRNNHTVNRQALSNRVSGDRRSGFVLTVPGQRAAADVIRTMTGE